MQKTKVNNEVQPISVPFNKLCEVLGCGRSTAEQIARDSKATVQLGRRKLYNLKKIQQYMDNKSE